MTIVVINAISIKEGGSLVVLKKLLCAMFELKPDWQWHIATNCLAADTLSTCPGTICHIFPDSKISSAKVRLWYEVDLPRLLQRVKADILFSQTNYLPTRKLVCPSILLVQHAGHFSERFKNETEAQLGSFIARLSWRLKGRWVRSSVRRAQVVTVQTQALATQIESQVRETAKNIRVIAHGIGHVRLTTALPRAPSEGHPVRIGYITKFGVQKNFLVIFNAVLHLKLLGVQPVLVLTLASDLAENQAVLALAANLGIGDCLENHGELAERELNDLYGTLHLFAFPSWCESFGFPMLEAMAHGLPLLISATDSNIEIAGNAGLTFSPDDGLAIARLVQRLTNEPDWYRACAKASLARAQEFTWLRSAEATVSLIEGVLRGR